MGFCVSHDKSLIRRIKVYLNVIFTTIVMSGKEVSSVFLKIRPNWPEGEQLFNKWSYVHAFLPIMH